MTFFIRTEEKNRILYKADVENPVLRHIKIAYNLSWLREKNTVDFILNQMKSVNSIVLFGSFAKGENDKKSDVDILSISLSKSKTTAKLAKHLGRDTNLVDFTPAQWSNQAKTNKAFYLDVITDSVLLYGTKPVV
jgi:predicted nucleotidyltransferase